MKIISTFKIVITYFIFSTLWIKLSDTILGILVSDPVILTKIQTYKGMLFVIISSLLIFSLILAEQKKIMKESLEKEKYFSMVNAVMDNSNSWILIKDLNGEYFLANSKFLKDNNLKNIIGKKPSDIFPKDLVDKFQQADSEIINNHFSSSFEFTFNGNTLISTKFPIFDKNNNVYLIGGIVTDITQLRSLHKDSLIISKVFENSKDGIIIFNNKKEILNCNDAFLDTTLFSRHDLEGAEFNLLSSDIHENNFHGLIFESLDRKKEWTGELWLRKKNGEVFPSWSIFTKIFPEGQEPLYVGIFDDLTELKENKESIQRLGNFDLLTNLPNQFLMRDRLSQAILKAKLKDNIVAFLYLDLDNFRNINKYFDYKAGDSLICSVTERISSALRDDYTFARISGDEFAIIVPDVDKIEKVQFLTEKIKILMNSPFGVNQTEYKISLSIGIAVYPDDGTNTEELIKNAHAALEYVKLNGKNSHHFYSSALNKESLRKFELSNDLKYAIEHNELQLLYQPKINLNNDKVNGAEALIRWNHSKYGTISPYIFIPLAEENGEIKNIGKWVINEACSQMKKWQNLSLNIKNMAINLSPVQFNEKNIVSDILATLKKFELSPNFLEIEITEGMLMEDIETTINKLNCFKANGLKISVDDFGTGYSSLSYLKNFPLDTLKIDRTFVKDYPEKDDGTISKIIVNLAKSLNLQIVAEGVETIEQLTLMKNLGVEVAQGYYFYKPIPAKEIEVILENQV